MYPYYFLLLQLKKEIVFSKNVKIVNFPTRPVRYKTPKCYVAGWKTQSAKRKKTKRSLYLQNKTMEHILKEKAVDIISLKRCAKQNYQNYYNSMPIQLDDTFLCTKMHNQIFDICLVCKFFTLHKLWFNQWQAGQKNGFSFLDYSDDCLRLCLEFV